MVKYFPGISALIEREGLLKAQGAMLSLFTCLRLSHNAVGHRRMLKKLAQDCQCSADETFYSPYLSKTLGIGRKQKTLRGRARYNEIMIITKMIIIKLRKPPCVCLTPRTRLPQ